MIKEIFIGDEEKIRRLDRHGTEVSHCEIFVERGEERVVRDPRLVNENAGIVIQSKKKMNNKFIMECDSTEIDLWNSSDKI